MNSPCKCQEKLKPLEHRNWYLVFRGSGKDRHVVTCYTCGSSWQTSGKWADRLKEAFVCSTEQPPSIDVIIGEIRVLSSLAQGALGDVVARLDKRQYTLVAVSVRGLSSMAGRLTELAGELKGKIDV